MNIFKAATVITKTKLSWPLTEAPDKISHMSQTEWKMLKRDYNPEIQRKDANYIFQVKVALEFINSFRRKKPFPSNGLACFCGNYYFIVTFIENK